MEARSLLESKFGSKFASSKSRIKEKNLVIKVKKNMQEDELEKDQKAENKETNSEIKMLNGHGNCNETTMRPKEPNSKSQPETEIDDKEYRCNIKEEAKESQKPKSARIIDDIGNYEEEANNNENDFIEPLF
jgi:hypothetical protein